MAGTEEYMEIVEPQLNFATNRFGPWDYVVFALLLAVSSAIGLYYGCFKKSQNTTSEFLMAGRNMSIIPVTLSLLASFMSAITLLGSSSEETIYGTQYWLISVTYLLLMPVACYVYIPVFYNMGLTSVFEYLEYRFSKGVRVYCSFVFMVFMILYLALVLYAPCLALSVVTGLNEWVAVCSVGIVCTFYTTIGGMKAVMWTDVVQIGLMFAGLIGIIVKGAVDFDGFSEIWAINEEGGRINFWEPDPDPLVRHSFWTILIGGSITWLAIYGVNQAQVQRALCVPTLRKGQLALWLNVLGLALLVVVCNLCGMVIYAEYRNCDPIAKGRITGKDQLLALYVMDRMPYPGFPGLFTACIFSGGLSTISSGLNSLSAVLIEDLIKGVFIKDISDARATLASKICAAKRFFDNFNTLMVIFISCYGINSGSSDHIAFVKSPTPIAFGALMMLLTLMAANIGGLLQAALAIFGMVGGPILGLFTIGMIYPWTNTKGAYIGLTMSLGLTLWIGVGAQVYKPPVKGNIPPPMDTTNCPYINVTRNVTLDYYSTTTILTDINQTTVKAPSFDEQAGYLAIYQLSYLWLGSFALFTCTVPGLICSFVTGYTKPHELDPTLLSPLYHWVARFSRWAGCCDHLYQYIDPRLERNPVNPIPKIKSKEDEAKSNPEFPHAVGSNGYSSNGYENAYENGYENGGYMSEIGQQKTKPTNNENGDSLSKNGLRKLSSKVEDLSDTSGYIPTDLTDKYKNSYHLTKL